MAVSRLLLPLLALAGSVVGELQPIEVKGSKFFYKNGTQFFMKGIAYQQELGPGSSGNGLSYVDPLADEESCRRDVPLLKELGTNTIRTYAVDPTADHSACMKLLDEAGIYVISDLGNPLESINRNTPQWNTALLKRYLLVVDELARYSNVIGFFAGNEVTNAKNNTDATAYVKAAVRDVKKHIKESKEITRWLGAGYAANDDPDVRDNMADYFNCDTVEDSIDFWGINIYSWCGDSDMKTASFGKQMDFFRNYSLPTFFAEYGCNQVPGGAEGRLFTETTALYSDEMTEVLSGGIVYMYFQETNDYGLVKVEKGKAKKMKNFAALKKHANGARPTALHIDDYKPAGMMRQCPAVTSNWELNKALPPTPDQGVCDCMVKSLSCAPASDITAEKMGEVFGIICGRDPSACVGISGNPATGIYGAYSMCDDKAKLAFVLDAYHQKQNGEAGSCDFGGAAAPQTPSKDASCAASLSSATDVNKWAASATSPAGKATKSEENTGAHGVSFPPAFSAGRLMIRLYTVVALSAGVAVILF
ncbi:hypothetical protein RJ55_05394 [Drechmeria coniospora]|nr:hypothetical protein RJ55_05394 [Drechmeria coniospora]